MRVLPNTWLKEQGVNTIFWVLFRLDLGLGWFIQWEFRRLAAGWVGGLADRFLDWSTHSWKDLTHWTDSPPGEGGPMLSRRLSHLGYYIYCHVFANHLLSFNCKCCIDPRSATSTCKWNRGMEATPRPGLKPKNSLLRQRFWAVWETRRWVLELVGHNHVLPAWFTCFFLARPRLNKQPFGFVARQAPHQENVYFPCSFSSCAFLVTSLARTLRDRDQKNICIKKKRDQKKSGSTKNFSG